MTRDTVSVEGAGIALSGGRHVFAGVHREAAGEEATVCTSFQAGDVRTDVFLSPEAARALLRCLELLETEGRLHDDKPVAMTLTLRADIVAAGLRNVAETKMAWRIATEVEREGEGEEDEAGGA